MTPAELRRTCLRHPGAEETFPFGEVTSVFKVNGKIFALSPLRRQLPPELVRAEVRVDGKAAGASEARVDSVETARIAGELLGAVGERLEPGDRIIAGSIVQVPVERGAEIVADLGELGAVGVKVR